MAFLGIHIPLIGLLVFVLLGKDYASTNSIILFVLLMTLLATGITLLFLKKLTQPIEIASKTLNDYRMNRTVPKLPVEFKDEAGLLLYNIQKTISDNEAYITDKEDLVYLLSHDLKNFANNAQSLAKLILDENPSDPIAEYANLISKITCQQLAFIEKFIELLKKEDEISKTIPVVNDINLSSVWNLVLEQLVHKTEVKNIKLIIDNNLVNEVRLKIEEDLLIQILVNIIDNAIKFSHANSEIKISISNKNDKLVFLVTDYGVGFDVNYKEELFKKFTTRGQLGTADEPSTGIGLYLCKKIVEKHEGELLAESEGINKGATFSVLFQM